MLKMRLGMRQCFDPWHLIVRAAVIPVFGVIAFLALASTASAHRAHDLGARISGVAAAKPLAAQQSPHALVKDLTVYLDAASSKSSAADASNPGESSPLPCDRGCCCGSSAHCSFCSGTAIEVVNFADPVLGQGRSTSSVPRVARGTPPSPVDPPPRLLV